MKLFKALGSGAVRSVKAYKGVIIIWFFYLVLISLLTIPARGALKTGFGNSMITELLRNGMNIEVFSDLDIQLKSIITSFTSGFILVFLVTVAMNAFLSGGLFNSLKDTNNNLAVSEFFRSSARYFWSFLGVTMLTGLMIIVLGILIIGLPFGISFSGGSGPGPATSVILLIGMIIFSIALITLLLVVDYSRAWIVRTDTPSCFKALGFGFRTTFRFFLSSFPLMLGLMIILVLFTWLSLRLVGYWNPETGAGALMLYVVSQVMFFIKLLIKTWRYGSVIALMEMHPEKAGA